MTKKPTAFAAPMLKPEATAFLRGAETRTLPIAMAEGEAARSVRITVDLAPELHRRLKLQAASDGRRVADLVRDWIGQHCN